MLKTSFKNGDNELETNKIFQMMFVIWYFTVFTHALHIRQMILW